jgi:hypothetical protein
MLTLERFSFSFIILSFSVVTVPFGVELFVLARDVAKFEKLYLADVLDALTVAGFTKPFNTPIATYQGPDCDYPPVSKKA